MIELLINMADSLDERGLHTEASKVDSLIRKIAEDLEKDYLSRNMDYMENDSDDMSYEKSGLENPDKADLNNDDRISGYEQARGEAIEESMKNDISDGYKRKIRRQTRGWGG